MSMIKIEYQKIIIAFIIFNIFATVNISAETYDTGIGIFYFPGMMENFVPLNIELGVASDKGYGTSMEIYVTDSGSDYFKEIEEKENQEIKKSQMHLSSGAINLFYRIEKYVHRFDFGIRYHRNSYTINYTLEPENCGEQDSCDTVSQDYDVEYQINYAGLILKYSTTFTGYDYDDIYYSFQLIQMFRTNEIEKNPDQVNSVFDDDLTLLNRHVYYTDFIEENNPDTVSGMTVTIGWRF
jgi:hypothetical protein